MTVQGQINPFSFPFLHFKEKNWTDHQYFQVRNILFTDVLSVWSVLFIKILYLAIFFVCLPPISANEVCVNDSNNKKMSNMDQNLNITIKVICKHLRDSPQLEILTQNSNYRKPFRDMKVKELNYLYICSFLSLASTLIDRRQLLLKAN